MTRLIASGSASSLRLSARTWALKLFQIAILPVSPFVIFVPGACFVLSQ
jgi:hypothetical protein